MQFRMRFHLVALVCLFVVGLPGAVQAQNRPQNMNLIRDAEIEQILRDFAAPIFTQAGIPPASVHFVLVNSPEVNAFVAGGMNMFITTGLMRMARTPEELIGVMAHETGHIAGGHLVRSQEAIENASTSAIIATIAGIAAAAASRDGSTGAAAISLGQQVAQRNFLSYSRTQESSADQAALGFLDQAHISATGMHDFLKRLGDQELLPENQQIQFVRTHPLTRDRIDSVAAHVAAARPSTPLPASYSERFARLQAKLEGFIDPRFALNRYPPTETGFAGRYARSIALHQTGDTRGALTLAEELLKAEPDNAYLHELKGQILYETGQAAAAIPEYRRAVSLADGNGLLRIGLAQALLDSGTASNLTEAQTQLEAAASSERKSPSLWRLLATAYGRQNQLGMAAYALSEEALASGNKAVAKQQASRAQDLLPHGSAGWVKAGDVLAVASEKDRDSR